MHALRAFYCHGIKNPGRSDFSNSVRWILLISSGKAGLVFYRVKWYNKNVCGAKTASGVIGDCQNRKQEDLFP